MYRLYINYGMKYVMVNIGYEYKGCAIDDAKAIFQLLPQQDKDYLLNTPPNEEFAFGVYDDCLGEDEWVWTPNMTEE